MSPQPSPATVRHLLLTKFNVESGAGFGDPARRLDDAWLRRRIEEFEQFCLPSVQSQTTQDFTWLVLTDEASPAWFFDYLDTIEAVTVVRVSGLVSRERVGRILDCAGHTDADYLLTTRLDNDDAVARTYMQDVRDLFDHQERLFVEFPLGYRTAAGSLYSALWRSNPFLTMFERRPSSGVFDTVFSLNHHDVLSRERVLTRWQKPMWLGSVHSTNTVVSQLGIPRRSETDDRFECRWTPSNATMLQKISASASGYVGRLQRTRKYRRARSLLIRLRASGQ